jgi:manganese efflux pump family protein
MWAAIALAFGLAMDATAVSAARGLAQQRAPGDPREVVILPLLFGGFQSGMAALGWLAGVWVGPYISAWDHWVAFGLLVAIGGKMLVEAWRQGEGAPPAPGTLLLYLGLALATSIDAAAAGITLPLVPAPPWLSLVLIGTITAACSLAGHTLGRFAGKRFGARLAMLGGVVLIAIAVELLLQHL